MQTQSASLMTNTGIKLVYRTWEGDGPPLVLIHGLASSMYIWDYVAPVLAARFSVIAYDQRGHGQSDKPDGGYDLDTMFRDLEALISALNIDKPVIVGHSWGATLALGYAAAHPEGCAGVALVDGGVMNFDDWPDSSWEAVSHKLAPPDITRFTINELHSRIKSGRPETAHIPDDEVIAFLKSLMAEAPDGTVRPRLSRENHMRILRTIWETRPAALFQRVKCPVLIILANKPTKDSAAFDERSSNIKNLNLEHARSMLEKVKIVEMKDTIHDIPLHRPEQLAEEILAFF